MKVLEREPVPQNAQQEQHRENEMPEPKEQAHKPGPELVRSESEIEIDRYGNEIINMSGPVEPELSREESPPLEPDSYIPDRQLPPPEHDLDFEMGD